MKGNTMANADIQQTMKQYRPTIMIGGGIALVLIAALVGWRVYDAMMTLQPPNVQTAPTAEVIAFISHKRGLAAMPQIEQEQFLRKWEDLSMQPDRKESLKKSLTMLDERQTKTFIKQILRYIKDRYIRDAERLATLGGKQDPRYWAFLREKVAQYETEDRFIKEVSTGLKATKAEFTPEKIQEWIMNHTTPEERDVGKRYFDALKKQVERTKNEREGLEAAAKRAATAAGGDSTTPTAPAGLTPTTQQQPE